MGIIAKCWGACSGEEQKDKVVLFSTSTALESKWLRGGGASGTREEFVIFASVGCWIQTNKNLLPLFIADLRKYQEMKPAYLLSIPSKHTENETGN